MSCLAGEKGAVHILFLIVVLVVALVFGALWFVQLQQNEDLENRTLAAERRAGQEQERFAWYRDYYEAIAPRAGFIPPQVPYQEGVQTLPQDVARENLRALEAELAAVGQQVDDPAASPTNLQEALAIPINRYKALKGELAQKTAEIERLKSEKAALENTISQANQGHEAEKTRIQQEHEADVSRFNNQLSELRAQNDEVQNRIREVTDQMDQQREEFNRERQQLIGARTEAEGIVRSMKRNLTIERAKETPDGKILSVDPVSGMVMVDITSRDQLRRGTRFKVYETGKGNSKIHKGWVTVTDIGPNMSEARVEETIPGTGGLTAGDWLYNPFFSRDETTRFVFLGEVPGRLTREMAARILERFGAKVDESVNVHTSFLVLGEKEDPDAPELTESPEYRNALTWGVEIIRAQDLAPFLQM